MSTLFTELKRRNIFKVAVAYLVVSWLVVQVAGTIAPMMNLPDVAPRYILFMLIVLFPIVLFMAWIFDIKPTGGEEEAKSSVLKSLIPLGVTIIVLSAISYTLLLNNNKDKPDVSLGDIASAPATLNKASIAVLAFADLSPNGDQEYFGDGISESLLNVLAKIKELDVSSRTSSFAFKGKDRNVTDIGDILNVKHVLEGSVKKAGSRVLITAQLIDAPENRHLWSDTYERELTTENIFAIQAEIAAAIVKALGDELDIGLESEAKIDPFTANMDAYELYLQALKVWKVLSVDSVRSRVDLLERAVKLDPSFAEAWAMYAYSLYTLPSWDHTLERAPYEYRAIEAAERALKLDPSLKVGYDSLIAAYFYLHQWEKGYAVFEQAQKHLPDFEIEPRFKLGLGYLVVAYNDAVELSKRDPDNSYFSLVQALSLEARGENKEALEQFKHSILKGYSSSEESILEIKWDMGDASHWLAYYNQKMIDYAPELIPLLPHLYDLHLGMDQNSPKAVAKFKSIMREMGFTMKDLFAKSAPWGDVFPSDIVVALGYAERIADDYWSNSPKFWIWAQDLHSLRQTEAFRSRVRSSGMLAYWQKHGWPDLCRPKINDASDDGFECD